MDVNQDMQALKFKSTEELVREKQGLEDFAAMAMAEGVEPSEDIVAQITQLRAELERRDAANKRAESATQWIGASVGGARVESLMHEGRFAYVFRAGDKVIRLAKADVSALPAQAVARNQTFAFQPAGDDILPAVVAPHMVLREQIEALNRIEGMLPGVLESRGFEGERPFYVMPHFEGQTLRELIDLGSLPLDVYLVPIFRNLVAELAKLSSAGVAYHGNLKPEHVLVTRNGIRLLSPGSFGSLVVTTPEYYPYLSPDDMLAVGIMLFEAVCKVHPFAVHPDASLERRMSPEFYNFIQQQITTGRFSLSGVLRFRMPGELKPALSVVAQEMLIKALRLRFTDSGQLAPDKGFATWSEFDSALESLSGI